MKKVVKILLKILGVILAVAILIAVAAGIFYIRMSRSGTELAATARRLDKDGYLYYMDCCEDIYSPVASLPLRYFTLQRSGGCSAFITRNENSDVITCRNYDLPHKTDDGNITGLNVVLRCEPEGMYKSLCVADACWISILGLDYTAGNLENSDLNKAPLALIPYLCMDGINEKGLTVSILALDLKEGETAVNQNSSGKERVIISYLLRYMLDSCSTIEEAENLARQYNLVSLMGGDYHLFVTDATGNSAVFEWRYNELKVIYTDAVTNFYVGFDDAEDSYVKGKLREAYTGPADTEKDYSYGYGHGYERFKTLVRALDGINSMSDSGAMRLLDLVAQDYTGEMTSFTQYSVVYNSTQKSMTIRCRDELFNYSFD